MSVMRKQALQAVLVATCLSLLAAATPVSASEAQSGADRGHLLPYTLPLGRSAALMQDDSHDAAGSSASSPLQLLTKAQQLTLFEATELGVQQSEATLILFYSCSRAGTYEVQIGKYRMPGEGRIVKLSPCSQAESQLFIAAPIVA
eukprot:gene9456-9622_t